MIHINPIDYPKLNKREIKLEPYTALPNAFKVTVTNGSRLFYGKKLTIFIGNSNYVGRYSYALINETLTNLLIFDGAKPNITTATNVVTYETFVVPEDNQALTFQDLHEKFESHRKPAIVKNHTGIDDIGSSNLVDGFQTLKIDQSLYGFKLKTSVTLTNRVTTITNVKVSPDKVNQYKFQLYTADGKVLVNFELVVTGNCDNYYVINHSHISQSESFENEKNQYINGVAVINNIKLSLRKIQFNNEIFVDVRLQLTNNTTYTVNGYVSARHPNDLWTPDESQTVTALQTLNLNNATDIKIDQTLLFADKCGEQRTVMYGTTLGTARITSGNVSVTNLDTGYYTINKSNAPYGIPGKTHSSNLNYARDLSDQYDYFKTLVWTTGILIVMPTKDKYMLYVSDSTSTNFRYVFFGSKFDIKDVKWSLVSIHGHKHSTDDLDVGDNKFVTQDQIDLWNNTASKLNNLSWKQYLLNASNAEATADIDASLRLAKGNVAVKFDSLGNPIIHVFDGASIIPTSIGSLTVEGKKVKQPELTGTLITPTLLEKLKGLGIGYKINDAYQYILIDNIASQYGTDDEKTFFDLVLRTNTTRPGDNSVNFGISNDVATDNSVFYGIGLKSINGKTDKTIIGKWNNPITKSLFEVGAGTISSRKTIIWYVADTIDGIKKNFLNVDGNYYNNNPDQRDYILINGNEPILNNFVTRPEFEPVKEKVDEILEYSVFVKLIPLNTAKAPIIQRLLSYSEYSKYNLFDIWLTISGKFGDIIKENFDDDGILISRQWALKSKYTLYFYILQDPDDEEEDDSEDEDSWEQITNNDYYFDSETGDLILELPKATILKVVDSQANKTYQINLMNYINSLDILSSELSINMSNFPA